MDQPPRRPPPEPEIIPPGQPLPRRGGEIWTARDTGAIHRIHVRQIGPVGVALLTLGVGAVAGLSLLFLLSAAVIGFAMIGVLTVAGVVAGLLRGPPRPLR
jgi:hypothetical protein